MFNYFKKEEDVIDNVEDYLVDCRKHQDIFRKKYEVLFIETGKMKNRIGKLSKMEAMIYKMEEEYCFLWNKACSILDMCPSFEYAYGDKPSTTVRESIEFIQKHIEFLNGEIDIYEKELKKRIYINEYNLPIGKI